jgi:hypothetical protein
MLEELGLDLDQVSLATWLVPSVGLMVAGSVYLMLGYVRRRFRRRRGASREEDLSWQDLLASLRRRRREREKAGLSADEDLPPEELFKELLAGLPADALREPVATVEDLLYQTQGGLEKRSGRRRWGNPTEVHVILPTGPSRVHGLVINRSTGGLAILVQQEVPAGTSIKIHSVEAPRSVPFTELQVCHCRKAGRLFLIGCEFREDVPWNVRVWFG